MEQYDWFNLYVNSDGIFLDTTWLYIGIWKEFIFLLLAVGVLLRIRKVRLDKKRASRRRTSSI